MLHVPVKVEASKAVRDDGRIPFVKAPSSLAAAVLNEELVRLGELNTAVAAAVAEVLHTLKWKQSVRVASTANGTLASAFENGDTLDGVTLATSDRILLKNQTTGSENGIYVVNASGAPTRATDADVGAKLVSAVVAVEQGTANADRVFVCTTNAITLGSTSLVWVSLVSAIGAADASHTHPGSEVSLDSSDWHGSLAGSGIVTVQDLANWIDVNFHP